MLNFNKDESCKFLQSLLINHYFDISITSFMQQIIISYIQIFIFLLSTYTRNVYMSSKVTFSSGTVRSSTSSQFISATPTTSNFALVFCRRCCHSSKTFLPHFVLYCVVSEWLPTPDWSLLLYSSENETDQPCFYYKS